MKQFYRLNLKEQSAGLNDLSHDVGQWRQALTEIFLATDADVKHVPATILESLLACQDEDGLCRILIDDETPPSEARVDFWYWPTYFLTASLIREQMLADQMGMVLSEKWQKSLKKGLLAATTRKFAGHGYSAEDVRIAVMNFFLDAGTWLFLENHGVEHPEFANLFKTLLEQQRQAILAGKTQMDYSDYAKAWQDLQARTGAIMHLFTYGTLMTGQLSHERYLERPGCQLAGPAILSGYHLYDLGAYPAIVPGDSQTSELALVVGELYEISTELLPLLDAYEGEGDLYNRVAAVVKTATGERHLAWIYEYNHKVKPDQIIPLAIQPWNSEPIKQISSRYVWYVAYGSNLLRERFLCYIKGGWFRDVKSYQGCKDKSVPLYSMPFQVPYEMYYGNQSKTWQGGGVCFLDAAKPGHSIGRAYLVTREQFADIHMQEGKSDQWYDQILDLGLLHGVPALTFTNHTRRPEISPSYLYLKVVKEGMKECECLR